MNLTLEIADLTQKMCAVGPKRNSSIAAGGGMDKYLRGTKRKTGDASDTNKTKSSADGRQPKTKISM